jgi:pimeloyl-ACP methyl ester carboxylesterase
MYYELHGTGEPLLLLHGALSTIETSFGAVLPSLGRTRRVIAVAQQGHGRTADIDRPLSFAQIAEDTATLLRELEIDRTDVFGYSMGAGIALELAIRQPGLVRKLVLASLA